MAGVYRYRLDPREVDTVGTEESYNLDMDAGEVNTSPIMDDDPQHRAIPGVNRYNKGAGKPDYDDEDLTMNRINRWEPASFLGDSPSRRRDG